MDSFSFRILCLLLVSFSTANSQFINVQRTNGGSIILICNSTMSLKDLHYSKDDLAYEWYIDNDKQQLKNDKHHTVIGNKLILKRINDNISHDYKCVIEIKSIGAKLAVSKKLNNIVDLKLYRNKRHKNEALKFITKMLPNKNFELGSTGKIHCKATGSKSIYWKKNRDDALPKNVDDVNGTLIFSNIDVTMIGMYTCFATNDDEQITHQIEVKILPAFEVVPPARLIVDELQNVTLNCVGSGSPIPAIKWDYETNMINADSRFQIYENGSLFLQEVRIDESGNYGCTIGNSAGFKRSETQLIVRSADSQNSSDEEVEESSNLLSNKAVLITCLLAIIYILCVIVLMIWCRQRRSAKQNNESDPEQMKLNEENDNHDEKASPKHKALLKSLSTSFAFDIRYEKITELEKIGIDNNLKMEILTGFLCDSDLPSKETIKENSVTDEISMQQQTRVLIRTIKRDQDAIALAEFRRQVDLYCTVDSQNVVKLFGLSKESKIYGMILEHSDDLRIHLTENANISFMDLLKFCLQVANGMHAIHTTKLIHRDIQLDNCIITKESIVKLTSKTSTDSSDCFEYNSCMLSLRHVAPEVLLSCSKSKNDIKYSSASDIYAFGITMWEILNKGAQPFKSLSNDEFLKKLQTKSLDYGSLSLSSMDSVDKILLNCLKNEACDRINSNDLINCLEEAMTKNNSS